MTTHPDPTGVLADLDAVIANAPEGATGALWRLTGAARGLDANLVRLRPDAVIAEHAEPVLDVLLVVVDGAGRIDTEDGSHRLRPHSAVLLARGALRSLTAGPQGMTYLTVHTRRPGLGIGAGPAASPAAGLRAGGGGGESACLLHRVCPDCGRLATESGARYCSRCGAGLPG
ncbi:hypothetical protein [Streptomyces lavendulae]|uniref:hypothetical protein n=1 Tax=Streptomyces lavendulae TaxID=1914 RepID=UPI0024A26619|nr:hypothetical protein [Streptomyces lavendulae]GLV96563.1 hypothetical protein Slala05_01950 [Streptomyces lavendulae subsp. lavendulae]